MRTDFKKILILGHSFPEPRTTAAGSRIMQLIHMFAEKDFEIVFASTAVSGPYSEDLADMGILTRQIALNDSSFDVWLNDLNPDVVVFDRFMTEEQFGWRVAEQSPKAIRILDTEDLHFLRRAREEAVRKGREWQDFLFSDVAKREIAAIFRCDLSLIISETEMDLLNNIFKVPEEILFYLPLVSEIRPDTPGFSERRNFMTIGNLRHAPNVDSVKKLRSLWSEIRKALPETECHIYGAYASQQISELDSPQEGFRIKGWIPDSFEVFSNYRLLLAPLSFGAGLKGKIIDAFSFGMPVVTTETGAEGIAGNKTFGGIVTNLENFEVAAISLYTNEKLWNDSRKNGQEIIADRFAKDAFDRALSDKLKGLYENREYHRQRNFFGRILEYHLYQSTKFMSRWIEVKNQKKSSV